jgi:hypothetical protein
LDTIIIASTPEAKAKLGQNIKAPEKKRKSGCKTCAAMERARVIAEAACAEQLKKEKAAVGGLN